MINFSTPVENTIMTYILIMVLLIYIKPNYFFDNNGKIKRFGYNKNNKIFITIHIIALITVILTYTIFTSCDLLLN